MPRIPYASLDQINEALAAEPDTLIKLTEDEFDMIFDYVPSAVDRDNFFMELDEANAFPRERVWTAVDGDEGSYLIPGFHRVNRFANVVSVQPWPSENIEVKLDAFEDDEIDDLSEEEADQLVEEAISQASAGSNASEPA